MTGLQTKISINADRLIAYDVIHRPTIRSPQ